MRSRAPPTTFQQLKREELLAAFIPVFFRVRLLAVPALFFLLCLFVAFDEPRWKAVTLGATAAFSLVYFVYELVRFGQRGPRDWTIGINLLVIAAMQTVVFFLTGGLESPLLPAAFLFVFAANVIYERGPWGVTVYATYVLGITVMAVGDLTGTLPNAGPAFLRIPGGFAQKPAFFVTLYAVYLVMLTNTTLMSRNLSRMLGRYHTALADARTEVVESFGARMRDLETIGSRVAHEIKNPLGAISGLVQVMARAEPGDPRAPQRLEVVRQEVARIEGIVNEFSNFSRPLDELRSQVLDACALVRTVEGLYEVRLAQAGVTLVRQAAPPAALLVRGDGRKLKQVLINVVENAIAAMPDGGNLGLGVRAVEPDRVEVVVSDSGPGVPADKLERLFDPFFTTKEGGTGLGLTIARGIVEQHHGELRLESDPEVGTRVVIRLPAADGDADNDDDDVNPDSSSSSDSEVARA